MEALRISGTCLPERAVEKQQAKARPRPIAYPRDAVLTLSQLAAALQVEERTVQGMDLPFFYAGKRQRWLWSQVLDTLAERAVNMRLVGQHPPATSTAGPAHRARRER